MSPWSWGVGLRMVLNYESQRVRSLSLVLLDVTQDRHSMPKAQHLLTALYAGFVMQRYALSSELQNILELFFKKISFQFRICI